MSFSLHVICMLIYALTRCGLVHRFKIAEFAYGQFYGALKKNCEKSPREYP